MTECKGGEPWVIRTFDLRDANHQCAVSPPSSKFAHIAVRNPSGGEAAIFRMLALPFGSIKAVHSFFRVAHSVSFILVAHLGKISTNYFDDFVVIGRKSEATHLTHIVSMVFKLRGWAFAETGPKAPDFAAAAQALGVRVDVSSMHLGSVWVDNTESRKSDFSSCIRDVLQRGQLGLDTAETTKKNAVHFGAALRQTVYRVGQGDASCISVEQSQNSNRLAGGAFFIRQISFVW